MFAVAFGIILAPFLAYGVAYIGICLMKVFNAR